MMLMAFAFCFCFFYLVYAQIRRRVFSPTSLDFALSVELIVFFAVCRDLVDVLDLMKMTTVDLQVTRGVLDLLC